MWSEHADIYTLHARYLHLCCWDQICCAFQHSSIQHIAELCQTSSETGYNLAWRRLLNTTTSTLSGTCSERLPPEVTHIYNTRDWLQYHVRRGCHLCKHRHMCSSGARQILADCRDVRTAEDPSGWETRRPSRQPVQCNQRGKVLLYTDNCHFQG